MIPTPSWQDGSGRWLVWGQRVGGMVLVGGLFRVSGLMGWFWSGGWCDGWGQGVDEMVGVSGLV